MSDPVYRKAEFVGTSTVSVAEAIRGAVKTAARTVGNPAWFEVMEVRGHIKDEDVDHFQVVLKVGFKVED